jgi:GTPase SAR1 family protein
VVASTDLIDRALRLADACDRPDLHRRLRAVRERVLSPSVRVLVVGEAKKGKSSLVNALVGAPVCAVADDEATVVPTVVRHGTTPRAALVLAGATDDAPERVAVALDELQRRVAAALDPGADRELLRVEVELPRRLLEGGLEIVDTAGVGGIGTARSLAAIELLPTADAVLVVSDASQEFTAPEMAFLHRAVALCPNVVVVLTKIDASPDWRTILRLDRGHLGEQGVEAEVLAVASPLALLAVQQRDRELHEESGIGALSTHLRREVVERADVLAQRSLLHDLTDTTEHLALAVRSELSGLEDPAGQEALVRDLEAARAAVEDLRRRSSRWQQLLGDGVTDLMADIDHDLRDRSRVVSREAEEAIDAQDPGPAWPELSAWLDDRIAGAVADSFVWAEQRSEYLAEQVLDQFARDGGAAQPELSIGSADEVLGAIIEIPDIDAGQLKVRERLLIGVRGSYTGVLMTGLVTSLAGMALINPLSLAAGMLLGRKAYNDDKAARLQRRRTEAKAVVRRHLDEVVFQVSKHLKDRLRLVQRALRDVLNETIDTMSRSYADAVQAASRSTREATQERDARIRELRAHVVQIERLALDVREQSAVPAGAR